MKYGENEDVLIYVRAGSEERDYTDWAEMLLAIYMAWASKKGFRVVLGPMSVNEKAGINNGVLLLTGKDVYDVLKNETGVHRLRRVSPFSVEEKAVSSYAWVIVSSDLPSEEASPMPTNIVRDYDYERTAVLDFATGKVDTEIQKVMEGNLDLFLSV